MLNGPDTHTYHKETNKKRAHKETLTGVEYVYYLDCGEGVTGVCLCPNSSNYAC